MYKNLRKTIQQALFGILISLVSFSFTSPAGAILKVDITQGMISPVPIAVADFTAESSGFFSSGDNLKMAQDIVQVVKADLKNCGIFQPLDSRAFIQRDLKFDVLPRFAEWRKIQTEYLIVGKIYDEGDRFKIAFRLYDVLGESQQQGFTLTAEKKDWRRVAHKLADEIHKQITGEPGYFDTKIVYVEERGSGKTRVTRLAMMDQDGANHQYLTNSSRFVMTPRFTPSVHGLAFLDFGKDQRTPQIYLMNLKDQQSKPLGQFTGMTFAPYFSPDGQTLLLSMSNQEGNSSVYSMNLGSRQVFRLTRESAIDTSANYSPDGKFIVFNSDRQGTPQLFIMRADGSEVRRISYGPGSYWSPVWSPRGDWIAFIKMSQGSFYIGIMRPDGSGERLLAQGYLVEDPTWSPNGRMIIFSRQDRRGRSQLRMIDITGYHERIVPTPSSGAAVSPAWSPLIP